MMIAISVTTTTTGKVGVVVVIGRRNIITWMMLVMRRILVIYSTTATIRSTDRGVSGIIIPTIPIIIIPEVRNSLSHLTGSGSRVIRRRRLMMMFQHHVHDYG